MIFKKKILFLVLGSLLSLSASANEIKRSDITDDWLKNKNVTNLTNMGFMFGDYGKKDKNTTTTMNSVQYYLFKSFDNGSVHVLCFVDSDSTVCRLP